MTAAATTTSGRSPVLTLSVAGAVAVVCASTALSGVIGGASWFAYVLVTVLVMIAIGAGLPVRGRTIAGGFQ
jgi:hypothetical protein